MNSTYYIIIKLLTVFPVNAKRLRYFIIITEVKESIPVVGSSIITIGGLDIISYAILVLFLSPPDIPFTLALPINVSAHFSNPNYIKYYYLS
jgi:hypothetical protein